MTKRVLDTTSPVLTITALGPSLPSSSSSSSASVVLAPPSKRSKHTHLPLPPPNQVPATPIPDSSTTTTASVPAMSDSLPPSAEQWVFQHSVPNKRANDIPKTPVVDVHSVPSNTIYTSIVERIVDGADLARLARVSKAFHVPATIKLWSGTFFPTVGYFSLSSGRFLLVDSVTSRWFILALLCHRPDLASLVYTFKITEGQENIEQLPILPNLRKLVIEHRGRREQNSGYHDHRLVQFLAQHEKIEELHLIGATYEDPLEMDRVVLPNFKTLELQFSQMPNWLNVTSTQITSLTLTGAKGRPPPTTTDPDDTFATPDPTPFKFPDDRTMAFVAPSLGGLLYLDVSCCVDISATGLAVVLHSVPELTTLALHFCQKLDIPAAISKRPSLAKLTNLKLYCKIRCGATLTSFSAYSGENRSKAIIDLLEPGENGAGPHLTSLTISGQTTLWERRILVPGFVASHCATLKSISLIENMIDADELTNVCEKCQELEELCVKNPSDLHDPTLTEPILAKAGKLRWVKHATGNYLVKRLPANPGAVELVLV